MKKFDFSLFDDLVPVRHLSSDDREQLLDYLDVVTYSSGRIIFSQGDDDNMTCYLCSGEVELAAGDGTRIRITSVSADAKYPLAHVHPRQYTARTMTESSILIINKSRLDGLIAVNGIDTGGDNHGVLVSQPDAAIDTDWMSYLLASDLFSRVSAASIQNIFSRIEAEEVRAGHEIIHQGEPGDYFYIIKQGECEVFRQPSVHARSITISRLRPGETFGEEALITGGPNSVSVIMSADGELLKLHRSDFEKYLMNEVVHGVELRQLHEENPGDVVFLDVRYPDEPAVESMHESINIPLNILRIEAGKLDRNRRYVVICGNGIMSKVAVFLLAQNGIEARYLVDGLVAGIACQGEDALFRGLNPELSMSSSASYGSVNDSLDQGRHLVQAQGELINALRDELEDLRNRLDQSISDRHTAEAAVRAAELQARKTISKEYRKIRETMHKAVTIYEDIRVVKEKLLEDRVALKNLIENQKRRQEELVNSIEEQARSKVSSELKKIEDFYTVKEKQIRQLQKLKAIAEKRLQLNQRQNAALNSGMAGNSTLNARLQILENSTCRDRIRSLHRQETEDLVSGLRQAGELPGIIAAPSADDTRRQVDIDSINCKLMEEQSVRDDVDSADAAAIAGSDASGSGTTNSDIRNRVEEQHNLDNSREQLRKLREKREIIRRIYEHASRKKLQAKVRNRALITEINSALENHTETDDKEPS